MPPDRRARASGLPILLVLLLLGACSPMRMAPGPGPTEPRLVPGGIVAADGFVLPLRAWRPDPEAWPRPRAVVLALHGFNDYADAIEASARAWEKQGIATYAYDQRGFGRGRDAGLWPGSDVMVEDVRTASRLLKARYPETPLYVLGLSMGGAVAILAFADAEAPPAEGVILVAPAVWARETMPAYQRAALWFAARVMPGARFSGRGSGIKVQASDNVAMLRRLGADPLFIKRTRVDAIDGLTDLMSEAYASAPRLEAPALLLYGEKDEIVPKSPTLDFWRALPTSAEGRQRKALYRDGWHMLLRDLQARVVREDVVAWIDDPAAPLPSAADRRAALALAGDGAEGATAIGGNGDDLPDEAAAE